MITISNSVAFTTATANYCNHYTLPQLLLLSIGLETCCYGSFNFARGCTPVPPHNSGKVWNFTGATPSPARHPDKHPLNM